jgi:dipeptidase
VEYTAYVTGKFTHGSKLSDQSPNPNGYVSNRLPLWVKPDSPIALRDMMARMRDHYEDTPLDMRNDPGAGPYKSPYRWRPMEFEVDSVMYLCERAVATQQTGYSFVAQSRSGIPDTFGGIFWFGVDDADGCVYAPMYSGISRIPVSYAVGNGSMINWSETSAYWTFSQVNNWAYSRYNVIHPEIKEHQSGFENQFIAETSEVDQKATEIFKGDPKAATEYITNFSVSTGDKLVADWKNFYRYLFMKYHDGNIKVTEGDHLQENGFGKNVPKRPLQPGYGKEWERIMIQGTGDRFKIPKGEL